MRQHRTRGLFVLSLIVADAVMAVFAFILAYYIRIRVPVPEPPTNVAPLADYLGLMMVQVASVLLVMFFNKQYHTVRNMSHFDQFSTIFGAVSLGTMISVATSALTFKNTIFEVDYPRAMIIYDWLLTVILVTLGRFAHQSWRAALYSRGMGQDRVLIVGTGEIGQMILEKIRWSPYLGYKVVGFADGDDAPLEVMGIPVLGRKEALAELIKAHKIDEVIIAMPETPRRELVRIISTCEQGKTGIKIFPDVFQIMTSQVTIGDLGGLPLLTVRDIALRGWRLALKRTIDVAGACAGLVLFSPLMMLMAFLIKLESPGPVFYAQERAGLDARPFQMLKFRTMRADAESDGPGWTTANDPRRTRLGAILRRLSVDELPQFINVLVGDMSLVGPRPERPVFIEQFRQSVPRYMDRHREKAGMTGWAQVNGLRGDTSVSERTKYDLWYVENWSLWLDIKIMLRTLFRAFFDKTAY